jgi:hypothetical protein
VERVKVEQVDGQAPPARSFADYTVKLDETGKPEGVTIEEKV